MHNEIMELVLVNNVIDATLKQAHHQVECESDGDVEHKKICNDHDQQSDERYHGSHMVVYGSSASSPSSHGLSPESLARARVNEVI